MISHSLEIVRCSIGDMNENFKMVNAALTKPTSDYQSVSTGITNGSESLSITFFPSVTCQWRLIHLWSAQ